MAIEIDGPPSPYLIWARKKVRYKTIAVGSMEPVELTKVLHTAVERVRYEAEKHNAVVFWRRRPVLEYDVDSKKFKGSFRVATFPDLPSSVWGELPTKREGDNVRYLEEEPEDGN
jgi:hypothetical protein